jgi:hypothetical protein
MIQALRAVCGATKKSKTETREQIEPGLPTRAENKKAARIGRL